MEFDQGVLPLIANRWRRGARGLALGIAITAAAVLAALVPAATSAAADERTSSFPLRFDAEVVRLLIEADSLRVEGLYTFVCRAPDTRTATTLLYPYPADSRMGAAHTELLEVENADASWTPLTFSELPDGRGVLWRIPPDLGATFRVRTVYHQALRARYARYIVTTTHSWGEPLRVARFEIRLPDGARPSRFSVPFERQEIAGNVFYFYQAEHFAPDCDILVEWESDARARADVR